MLRDPISSTGLEGCEFCFISIDPGEVASLPLLRGGPLQLFGGANARVTRCTSLFQYPGARTLLADRISIPTIRPEASTS
jgi:hypothetical protein